MAPFLAKALGDTGHELTQGLSSCWMENQFWSGLDRPKTVLRSLVQYLRTSKQRAEDQKAFSSLTLSAWFADSCKSQNPSFHLSFRFLRFQSYVGRCAWLSDLFQVTFKLQSF